MSRTRRASSTWPGLVLVVVVAVGAVLAAQALRPEEPPAYLRGLRQLRRHPALTERRRLPSLGELIEEALTASPVDTAVARAEHIPLLAAPDVHALFDEFLERQIALDPDLALGLGEPIGKTTSIDPLSGARWWVLVEDLAMSLPRTPRGDVDPAHDASDRALLLSGLELHVRLAVDGDRNVLSRMGAWLDAIPLLLLRENHPADVRAELTAQRLEALPGRLEEALAILERPPVGLTLRAAQQLASFRDGLGEWGEWFPRLGASLRSRLGQAVAGASTACEQTERRLREEFVESGRTRSGVGSVAFEGALRHGHLLDQRPVEILDRAFAAMDDAAWRINRMDADGPLSGVSAPEASSLAAALRGRVGEWVADVPEDPGIRVKPCPKMWDDGSAGAYYMAAAVRGRPGPGVLLLISGAEGEDVTDPEAATWFEHMVAHETYPGHHVQALFARETCLLRHFQQDAVFAEGWATYVEALVHGTDYCRGDDADAWRAAMDDWDIAVQAAFDVALQSGIVDDATLVTWLASMDIEGADLAMVGAYAESPGGGLAYLVGVDAVHRIVGIERAERRRESSLPEIHRDLLRAGALPPSLLEVELRALRSAPR